MQGYFIMEPKRQKPRAETYPISRAPIIQSSVQGEDEVPLEVHTLLRPGGWNITPELLWDLSRFPPLDRLPRSIVQTTDYLPPIEPNSWVPPIFHYGWRPNIRRMLTFARGHGLAVTYGEQPDDDDNILRPEPDYWRTHGPLDDVGFPKGGCEVPWQTLREGIEALWPPVDEVHEPHEINVHATLDAVIKKMMRGFAEDGTFGTWCTRNNIALTLPADEGNNYVISVMANTECYLTDDPAFVYDRPTPEDVERLGQALGVSGPPRWYVDRDDCVWRDMFHYIAPRAQSYAYTRI
ncbi:hypothetical protein FOMPIDRAFT_114416 [Fomitopsis schrenkii]|uniref:Uncharacterized protein n=1 Tax=Fomitopsis schrenkii TaxID=2126942 RepID=S8EAV1_FOMSC|nr:hypothetical protein FOMPIDRAFT_114416 [Fomitopsis schrenkii]